MDNVPEPITESILEPIIEDLIDDNSGEEEIEELNNNGEDGDGDIIRDIDFLAYLEREAKKEEQEQQQEGNKEDNKEGTIDSNNNPNQSLYNARGLLRGKAGRPKGRKTNYGLSISDRLKILKLIALDSLNKPAERISAIKMMTDLLNDKEKDEAKEKQTIELKFNQNTKGIPQKMSTKSPVTTPPLSQTTTNLTTTLMKKDVQPIDNKGVTKEDKKVGSALKLEINKNDIIDLNEIFKDADE